MSFKKLLLSTRDSISLKREHSGLAKTPSAKNISDPLRNKTIRLANAADAEAIHHLESSSYPADEKASLDTIRMRINCAAKYFLLMLDGKDVIAFINGTCTDSASIDSADCMTAHCSGAPHLVIHSVTVKESYRKHGLAAALLREYVDTMISDSSLSTLSLLSKPHLLGLYSKIGFTVSRLSPLHYGHDSWLEMQLSLGAQRQVRMWQVDAFTRSVFEGNPAAVVLMTEARSSSMRSAEWMQRLAAENNVSETAFVIEQRDGSRMIRWFSPTIEVDLCGHATLSAAHILFEENIVSATDTIALDTIKHGRLLARKNIASGTIELDFPLVTVTEYLLSEVSMDALLRGFGVRREDILFVGRGRDVVVELTPAALRGIGSIIDYSSVALIEAFGVILTCAYDREIWGGLDEETDFISRCFFPRSGINEDPVTGSAHCELADLWRHRLHKTCMRGFQASTRSGYVGVTVTPDASRVILSGHCVTVIRSKVAA